MIASLKVLFHFIYLEVNVANADHIIPLGVMNRYKKINKKTINKMVIKKMMETAMKMNKIKMIAMIMNN